MDAVFWDGWLAFLCTWSECWSTCRDARYLAHGDLTAALTSAETKCYRALAARPASLCHQGCAHRPEGARSVRSGLFAALRVLVGLDDGGGEPHVGHALQPDAVCETGAMDKRRAVYGRGLGWLVGRVS